MQQQCFVVPACLGLSANMKTSKKRWFFLLADWFSFLILLFDFCWHKVCMNCSRSGCSLPTGMAALFTCPINAPMPKRLHRSFLSIFSGVCFVSESWRVRDGSNLVLSLLCRCVPFPKIMIVYGVSMFAVDELLGIVFRSGAGWKLLN